MTQHDAPHRRTDREAGAVAAAARAVRQAPRPHDPVRDDRGSADLCAVDRELPAQLAERPARRRPHRGAGAGRRPERHGAGQPGAANPRQRRRPRGGDEDGHAAPAARRLRHAADDPPRHRHAQRAVVPRHPRCLRHAAVRRQGRDAGGRAGADGRRLPRDRAGRGAAAPGHAALLVQHHAAVAGHLGHHRDAGLFRAALPAGAADAPHHREHDAVPRRPGESGARHRRVAAARTRWAWPSASSPACSATSPRCCSRRAISRRSGSRCRRSTTICAICSPRRSFFSEGLTQPARPAGAALRAEADARARTRHCVLRVDAVLRPRAGAAAGSQARGGRRRWSRRCTRRWRWPNPGSPGSPRSSAASLSMPTPTSCLRVLLNLARNAVQALETRAPNDPARDQVRITGRREGAVVVIEVSDTGPGIPAKVARASVRGVPDLGAQRRNGPRPRHRRRTRPRPRRRDQAGRRHHRRDLPPHHSGPGGRTRRPPQRAGEGVSMTLLARASCGLRLALSRHCRRDPGGRAIADPAHHHSPRHGSTRIARSISSADGSRLLFKGKPISASGACPSDYMRGTVTRLGARHLPAAGFRRRLRHHGQRDWASAARAAALPPDLAKRGMKPIAMPRSAPLACGISLAERQAPVAQLDRALDYESRGREFESLRARQ